MSVLLAGSESFPRGISRRRGARLRFRFTDSFPFVSQRDAIQTTFLCHV